MRKRKPLTASEIIRLQYKGNKNFMTPHRQKVGKINKNVAFELSSGSGISGSGTLYGVTVVSASGYKTRPLHNKSKAFTSKNEAEAYINKLKKKMDLKRRKK